MRVFVFVEASNMSLGVFTDVFNVVEMNRSATMWTHFLVFRLRLQYIILLMGNRQAWTSAVKGTQLLNKVLGKFRFLKYLFTVEYNLTLWKHSYLFISAENSDYFTLSVMLWGSLSCSQVKSKLTDFVIRSFSSMLWCLEIRSVHKVDST